MTNQSQDESDHDVPDTRPTEAMDTNDQGSNFKQLHLESITVSLSVYQVP